MSGFLKLSLVNESRGNSFTGAELLDTAELLDASVPLETALAGPVRKKRTLIFGNEGSGLPKEFATFGQPVRIPSNDRIDSLNLAVAAAIGIYSFSKKDE